LFWLHLAAHRLQSHPADQRRLGAPHRAARR